MGAGFSPKISTLKLKSPFDDVSIILQDVSQMQGPSKLSFVEFLPYWVNITVVIVSRFVCGKKTKQKQQFLNRFTSFIQSRSSPLRPLDILSSVNVVDRYDYPCCDQNAHLCVHDAVRDGDHGRVHGSVYDRRSCCCYRRYHRLRCIGEASLTPHRGPDRIEWYSLKRSWQQICLQWTLARTQLSKDV